MKRFIPYLALGAIVVTGVVLGARRLRERFKAAHADFVLISGDTGDVMASATYQRFATRREAVLAMQKALLEVASIESAFVADSGRPITVLPPGGVKFDPNKIGVSIWLLRDRWVATSQTYSNFSTMTCMITAMVDTTTLDSIKWRYHAAAPRCAEASFNDSVLALLPPAPPLPAPGPPAPPAPVSPGVGPIAGRPTQARPHRDWGPVNNKPPRMPYIVPNTCQGEGCSIRGAWAACSTIVAFANKDVRSTPVFTISPLERFTALTGDVHVESPGVVAFRHPMVNPEGPNDIDSIQFTPADTLYLLNSHGEGYQVWYFRGQVVEGYQFWEDIDQDELPEHAADSVIQLRRAKTVRWVRVRNVAGTEGWIVFDYYKMATGGYMDEVERCSRK